MDQTERTTRWLDEEFVQATADPNVSVSQVAEEVPTMTVAAIAGVTVVILVAIVVVFVLGVLIDRRQQRLIEKQLGESKRIRKQRRVNTHPEDDVTSIANNMEESSMSAPPADSLRDIP